MNKPTVTRTAELEFPKGDHIAWVGACPFAGHNLKAFHAPTVAVITDPTEPLTFEGSFDGQHWAVIRDKDGEAVRITKAGVYRLPVIAPWLRPCSRGTIEVRAFIGRF